MCELLQHVLILLNRSVREFQFPHQQYKHGEGKQEGRAAP